MDIRHAAIGFQWWRRTLLLLCATMLLRVNAVGAQQADELAEADRFYEEGQWRKAARAYDTVLARDASQVPVTTLAKRAAIFLLLKEYRKGLGFVAEQRAKRGFTPELGEQEVLLYWAAGESAQAATIAEQVVGVKPATFSAHKVLAEYYDGKQAAKVAAAWQAYLDHRPAELASSDAIPLLKLGLAELALGQAAMPEEGEALLRFAAAEQALTRVQATFGSHPVVARNWAPAACAVLTGLAKVAAAKARCQAVLDNSGYSAAQRRTARVQLATLALLEGVASQAVPHLEAILAQTPNDVGALTRRGDAEVVAGRYAEAYPWYERAEAQVLGWRDGEAKRNWELSLLLKKADVMVRGASQHGDYEPGLRLYRTAHERAPARLDVEMALADALLRAGQPTRAFTLADSAGARPDFASASLGGRVLAFTIAARAALKLGKLDHAEAQVEAAWALVGAQPGTQAHGLAAQAMIGVANAQAKRLAATDLPAARARLMAALQALPAAPSLLANAALVELSTQRCEEAMAFLQRWREVAPAVNLLRLRLEARAAACMRTPDDAVVQAKLTQATALAEAAGDQAMLAELWLEAAALRGQASTDAEVEKLDFATRFVMRRPDLQTASKRALALALMARATRALASGDITKAALDLTRVRTLAVALDDIERHEATWLGALVALERGNGSELASALQSHTFMNGGGWLDPADVNLKALLRAYLEMRTGAAASRKAALATLAKLRTGAATPATHVAERLWGAARESVAFESARLYLSGKTTSAQVRMESEQAYAALAKSGGSPARVKRALANRLALMLRESDVAALEGLEATVPEAGVNLGILYEQQGRPEQALQAWQRAKARGIVNKEMERWIDAKRRLLATP